MYYTMYETYGELRMTDETLYSFATPKPVTQKLSSQRSNKPLSEKRASFSLPTADFWFSH